MDLTLLLRIMSCTVLPLYYSVLEDDTSTSKLVIMRPVLTKCDSTLWCV